MTITYDAYDDAELAKVARIVIRLNPYQFGNTVENVVHSMKGHALCLDTDRLGYVAISGWMLSAYRRNDGTVGIKPSVSDILFDD